MIKTINKTFLILFCIFFSACALRIGLDKFIFIDKIISVLNVASFLYVFYIIFDNSGHHLVSLLNNNKAFGENIIENKKNYFKKFSNIVCVFVAIIGIVYSIFLANSIVNDIIGFTALFLSLQSDYISETLGKIFYKKK